MIDQGTPNVDLIGVIGVGVVGAAIASALRMVYDNILLHDINNDLKHSATYDELVKCTGIFVCVPSPSNIDGSCDSSILESVLEQLHSRNYKGVIISKVTATPSIYRRLCSKYDNLVYSPEFLTERNAIRDYRDSRCVIVGGLVSAYMQEAKRIIACHLPNVNSYYLCTPEEASLVKYTMNSFLATKLVFMNEVEEIAQTTGNSDYNRIAMMLTADPRFGGTHMLVPGQDGKYGYGGACFPKDTLAFQHYADEVGGELSVLSAAIEKNTYLRLKKTSVEYL